MSDKSAGLDPAGLATRREVLGDTYVDAALSQVDDFSWPLQEMVTSNCWNDIWNRPGLPRATPRLVNNGKRVALNPPPELKVHLRGALNNGCSEEEIREVLLQSVAYCGFPAAMDGMRVAREVIAAYRAEQQSD